VLILAVDFNGLSIFGAPTFFQPIFKGGILVLAVGLSALARRYAAVACRRAAAVAASPAARPPEAGRAARPPPRG
jgi:hypothetical protein